MHISHTKLRYKCHRQGDEDVRVLRRLALSSAIVLEVLDESGRILADVAEVDGFTTFLEEEEAIEDLEELGRRLMDGTEDSLTLVREAPQEGTNGPGTLRVETRCRLVKEKQQFGLG